MWRVWRCVKVCVDVGVCVAGHSSEAPEEPSWGSRRRGPVTVSSGGHQVAGPGCGRARRGGVPGGRASPACAAPRGERPAARARP